MATTSKVRPDFLTNFQNENMHECDPFCNPVRSTSILPPLVRFNAFYHKIDRLLGLTSPSQKATSLNNWSPALDLHQDNDNFFVRVEVPGLKREDIALSLHDDLLTNHRRTSPRRNATL